MYDKLFAFCVQLMKMTGELTGTTYKEINLIVFCIIGPSVLISTLVIIYLQGKKIKKLTNLLKVNHMTYQDLRNAYADAVKNYLVNSWKIIPSFHLCDVIATVLLQKDGEIAHGGHFAQAVLNNDLRETISRADTEIQSHIKYVLACVNHFPSPAVRVPKQQANLVDNE